MKQILVLLLFAVATTGWSKANTFGTYHPPGDESYLSIITDTKESLKSPASLELQVVTNDGTIVSVTKEQTEVTCYVPGYNFDKSSVSTDTCMEGNFIGDSCQYMCGINSPPIILCCNHCNTNTGHYNYDVKINPANLSNPTDKTSGVAIIHYNKVVSSKVNRCNFTTTYYNI